jgi:hypothetical protein
MKIQNQKGSQWISVHYNPFLYFNNYIKNLVNQQNPVILSITAKSNHALPPHGGC